jgi:hypothetical protein
LEALAIPQFDSRQIAEPHPDPHQLEMEAL